MHERESFNSHASDYARIGVEELNENYDYFARIGQVMATAAVREVKKKTERGKIPARYTMWCQFYDWDPVKNKYKEFTYRDDLTQRWYAGRNQCYHTGLDALKQKFYDIGHKCQVAIIYDNSQPKPDDEIFSIKHGKVGKNFLRIPIIAQPKIIMNHAF